jgi:hypothetical protein
MRQNSYQYDLVKNYGPDEKGSILGRIKDVSPQRLDKL